MPRSPSFRVNKGKGGWYVSVPLALSPTGNRRREYFPTEEDAKGRAGELRKARAHTIKVVSQVDPEFIRSAVNYDGLFRGLYGFPGGLVEACNYLMAELEKRHVSKRFQDLLDLCHADRSPNWGNHSRAKWKWLLSVTADLKDLPMVTLTSDYLSEWMRRVAEKRGWNEQSWNDAHTLLNGVWQHAVDRSLVEINPMRSISRRKVQRRKKPVYSVDEVRRLMTTAWEHDREIVPYYAIAIFAGLRPDVRGSEITNLNWEDVNFVEHWIRVGESFDNKTATKRYVPLEENLHEWLKPWRDANGPVVPYSNLKVRREWLTKGRYGSPSGTPPDQWVELVPNGPDYRDITRHTYGSYLEAKYRDRNVVKENMGHTDFTTYEQHYRNARTPKEAEEFWSIVPPTDSE